MGGTYWSDGLSSGTKTKEYLDKLDEALEVCPDGVSTRDEKVFRFLRERNIPLVMLTS
ncbi:hypothetical protein BHE74_00028131, partial [Ensete ventricosum]